MKLGMITQQPAERFSYSVDYSEALPVGDNVTMAAVAVSPTGLTVNELIVLDPRVRFFVSGGVSGMTYKITLTVDTAEGRTFQDEISCKIKEQ